MGLAGDAKVSEFQIMEMAVPAERALDKVLEADFSMEDGIYR